MNRVEKPVSTCQHNRGIRVNLFQDRKAVLLPYYSERIDDFDAPARDRRGRRAQGHGQLCVTSEPEAQPSPEAFEERK